MLWWTRRYTCLFYFWFPQCVCPAGGFLGHMAVLFPVFRGISTLFSIVAVLVCIPTNSVRGFPFLHTLSFLVISIEKVSVLVLWGLSLMCFLLRWGISQNTLEQGSRFETQWFNIQAVQNEVRISKRAVCGYIYPRIAVFLLFCSLSLFFFITVYSF